MSSQLNSKILSKMYTSEPISAVVILFGKISEEIASKAFEALNSPNRIFVNGTNVRVEMKFERTSDFAKQNRANADYIFYTTSLYNEQIIAEFVNEALAGNRILYYLSKPLLNSVIELG